MNGCEETARRGVELVMPLILLGAATDAPVIDTTTANQREFLQRGIGDFLVRSARTGKWVGIEVKTERKYTGNLFVEAYSNKAHVRTREGWIHTLHADYLIAVYLDVEAAFSIPLPALKDWCIYVDGKMYDYDEKVVHLSEQGGQLNRTTGHPIPFSDIPAKVGVRTFRRVNGIWRTSALGEIRTVPTIYKATN